MSMYFIAIVLPPELNEKVLAYKKRMFEVYGCRVGLKSPAHITIVSPFFSKEKEEILQNDVKAMADGLDAFTIITSNFSSFAQRTVFIALEPNKQLNEVKEKADTYIIGTDYQVKKESRIFHPHITIATRDISKRDFFIAWPYFERKIFREEFIADNISLLKHNGSKWDVIYTANFPKPV